ncbi:MAG: type IV secretory system conjugative DNA transfer family protein [Alphaproteobacteria bacterium]
MNPYLKYCLWGLGGIIAIITSLYLSSVLYFLLNGWNPDNALPWSIFSYLFYTQKPYGMYLAISFIAPNALFAVLTLMWIFKPEDKNARWARFSDLRKARMKSKSGLILGQTRGDYLINDDPTHVFVVAPTRSGKGVGIVIPNLLAWKDSFICLDVKGENHRITSGYRASLGNKVINFCPYAKNGTSHCYNPLDNVSRDPHQRITDLQIMAASLIATAERSDPHFPNEAQDFFVGLALYVMDHKEFPNTIGSIFRLLGTEEKLEDILKYVAASYPNLDEGAKQLFSAYRQKAEKERSGIKSTLSSALKLWRNPVIDAVTSKSDFSFADIRKRRHAIYLGVAINEMAPLEPLMRLFFEQAITVLTDKEPDPDEEPRHVLMLLDEFHILGRMPIMSKAFTLLAGFNVRLLGVVQNIGLLDDVYTKPKRETILSNCAHQVFFASNNAETQRYVSTSCGEHTVKSKSVSKARSFNHEAPKVSTSEKIVPLIRPHEVNTFGDDKEIILVEKNHPIKCKKVVYYKDKVFKERLLPANPTPELEIIQNKAPRFDIPKPDNANGGKTTKKKTNKKVSSESSQQPEEPQTPENDENYSSYV